MRHRRTIVSTVAVVVIALAVLMLWGVPSLTGNTIMNEYTYTKALCNETHFCQDYIITCNDGVVIDQTQITGAMVQHADDWEDPRGNPNNLCE